MSDVLARWNELPRQEAEAEILPCCGSKAWARQMTARRPIHGEAAVLAACDDACRSLQESDWLEAFRSHPRIGESAAPAEAARSASWSGEEQKQVTAASNDLRDALAEGNRDYERRFSRIFIVCAMGKSAADILEMLQRRLRNDDGAEFLEAAEQQRQIAHIRLKKWLTS